MLSEADKTGSPSPKITLPEGSLAWADINEGRAAIVIMPLNEAPSPGDCILIQCGRGDQLVIVLEKCMPGPAAEPGAVALLVEARR